MFERKKEKETNLALENIKNYMDSNNVTDKQAQVKTNDDTHKTTNYIFRSPVLPS